MAKQKRLIRNGYVVVVTDEKLPTAKVEDYVYEHRLVAEEMLDRPLKAGEEVHHLDENKENNSPDNLLVLSGPMHAKLHTWLEKNIIIPKPEYAARKALGCVRCKNCQKPIDASMIYCDQECKMIHNKEVSNLKSPKEILAALVDKYPLTKVGELLNLSDNGVRKRCASLEIEIPKRGAGYWQKKKFNKV